MKKLQLLLLTLLIPFLGYTQINTFPWTNDFENYYGLEQDTTDDGDWLLMQGPTSSFNTGPQGDHTTGNGIYYYVESSTPNYPGKVFTTYTPTFDVSYTPGQVISFWYHMYGSSMGDLEVGIVDANGYQFLDIISGDQGDEWQIYYSTIPTTDTFKIQFTAITGTLYYSDICIDDLYVGDPFTLGCMDATALNYDASAIVDDGSCTYPPCQGFLTSNAYQNCQPNGQALTIFEWTLDTNVSCEPVTFHYWTPFNGPYQYGLNPNSTNFVVNAGTPNMPPNWSVPHFGQVEFADGSMSDTIFYTPYSCIPGCMDSTQLAYNPWANIDDGSCSGTTCDPVTETQITITIRLDNWPQETGWILTDGMGGTFNTPDGTYTYNDIGVTYTYTYCVSATGPFEFVISDTYGDGVAGNGTPGAEGEVVIYDCNGDTITYLSSGTLVDGNQTPVGVDMGGYPNGTVAYSGPQNGVTCAGPPVIDGCMDPAYVQYNPLANNSAPWLCYWLHTYGCTDSTSFNYDPTATINDIVDTCNYTLTIEDGAGDGWGNSYLGVIQGNNTWTFTMGPGPYSQSFPLTLDTDKPVTVYYFEVPNAQNPDPQQTQFQTFQNSFMLENADGVILLEEGTNPFANNGLGALQGFRAPFWTTYSATPYCGDYCIPTILGCTDITAFNYDSLANTDDGNCVPVVLGCTNNLAFNYDPLANTDDGSCIAEVIGCMDSTAFNFNPSANTNDPSSCIPVILGCMDDTMFNYNAAANTDDGSCIAIVYGCTDASAFNYDPSANTNNGSCIPVVLGCTNPTSFNYNQNANTDDGSCIPVVIGCTDPSALNYDSTANTNNGCIYPVLGCTDPTAFNFNINANTDDGSCIPVIIGCTDPSALNYDSTANTNSGCTYPILGCTDPTAFNFNVNANVDDSSCIPFIYGCTNNLATNYNPTANTDNGSCILPILGCTDNTMFNYNPTANTDNGSCVPFINGCTDNTMFNYDPLANTDNGSCIPFVYGCMDSTAFNYDPLANTDNGTCEGYVYGCTNPIALNYNPLANTDDLSCILPIYGCTDQTMFNYNPLANTDNGTCEPFVYGCTNPIALNYNVLANTDDGSCVTPIYGCMDSTMYNYNPLVNVDNGSCEPFIYGCNDATAFNYDPLANTSDNSCCYLSGCTDSTAVNYNSNACYDDGSCITPIVGCTDVSAYNYNPSANVSDSTACLYDAGCYGGPGIPYWLNDGCYAWVISVDDYCCTTDWDASCVSMYDYCQQGWPTAIEDISALGIVIYPNPTRDVITIETRLDIEVEVYDIMGKLLITKETKRIDLSEYPNGVYNLILIYNNKRFNTKVIKQ